MTIINKEENDIKITAATKSFIVRGSGLEITFVVQVGDDENELDRISSALARLAFDKAPVQMRIIPCEDKIFETQKRLGAGKPNNHRRHNPDDE